MEDQQQDGSAATHQRHTVINNAVLSYSAALIHFAIPPVADGVHGSSTVASIDRVKANVRRIRTVPRYIPETRRDYERCLPALQRYLNKRYPRYAGDEVLDADTRRESRRFALVLSSAFLTASSLQRAENFIVSRPPHFAEALRQAICVHPAVASLATADEALRFLDEFADAALPLLWPSSAELFHPSSDEPPPVDSGSSAKSIAHDMITECFECSGSRPDISPVPQSFPLMVVDDILRQDRAAAECWGRCVTLLAVPLTVAYHLHHLDAPLLKHGESLASDAARVGWETALAFVVKSSQTLRAAISFSMSKDAALDAPRLAVALSPKSRDAPIVCPIRTYSQWRWRVYNIDPKEPREFSDNPDDELAELELGRALSHTVLDLPIFPSMRSAVSGTATDLHARAFLIEESFKAHPCFTLSDYVWALIISQWKYTDLRSAYYPKLHVLLSLIGFDSWRLREELYPCRSASPPQLHYLPTLSAFPPRLIGQWVRSIARLHGGSVPIDVAAAHLRDFAMGFIKLFKEAHPWAEAAAPVLPGGGVGFPDPGSAAQHTDAFRKLIVDTVIGRGTVYCCAAGSDAPVPFTLDSIRALSGRGTPVLIVNDVHGTNGEPDLLHPIFAELQRGRNLSFVKQRLRKLMSREIPSEQFIDAGMDHNLGGFFLGASITPSHSRLLTWYLHLPYHHRVWPVSVDGVRVQVASILTRAASGKTSSAKVDETIGGLMLVTTWDPSMSPERARRCHTVLGCCVGCLVGVGNLERLGLKEAGPSDRVDFTVAMRSYVAPIIDMTVAWLCRPSLGIGPHYPNLPSVPDEVLVRLAKINVLLDGLLKWGKRSGTTSGGITQRENCRFAVTWAAHSVFTTLPLLEGDVLAALGHSTRAADILGLPCGVTAGLWGREGCVNVVDDAAKRGRLVDSILSSPVVPRVPSDVFAHHTATVRQIEWPPQLNEVHGPYAEPGSVDTKTRPSWHLLVVLGSEMASLSIVLSDADIQAIENYAVSNPLQPEEAPRDGPPLTRDDVVARTLSRVLLPDLVGVDEALETLSLRARSVAANAGATSSPSRGSQLVEPPSPSGNQGTSATSALGNMFLSDTRIADSVAFAAATTTEDPGAIGAILSEPLSSIAVCGAMANEPETTVTDLIHHKMDDVLRCTTAIFPSALTATTGADPGWQTAREDSRHSSGLTWPSAKLGTVALRDRTGVVGLVSTAGGAPDPAIGFWYAPCDSRVSLAECVANANRVSFPRH